MHEHIVVNTDACFEIDPITRSITQKSGKTKLIQGDHNSERYGFKLPRENDGHDMSLCNSVRINYINIGSGSDRSNGPYEVKDLHVDESNDKFVTFTWLVSRNCTKYAGTLNFNISFRCLSDSEVVYEWNTDICKGITVSSGIDNGNEFVENEEYIDILEQWKQEVLSNGGTATGTVTSVNGINPDESGNVLVEFPTKVSSFENDAGYLSALNTTDPHMQLVTDADSKSKWEERTHYIKNGIDTFVEEAEFMHLSTIGNVALPEPGTKLIVVFDGASYECEVYSGVNNSYKWVIGDERLVASTIDSTIEYDYPFAIMCTEGGKPILECFCIDSETHSVSIGYKVETIKTLDPKYLPEEVALKSDIPEGFSGSWDDLTDKPFYTERKDITHGAVSIGIYNLGYATLLFEFFPGNGEEYIINWDGTDYTCTAVTVVVDNEEVIVVGNTTFFGGSDNSDIPVGIISRSGKALVYSDSSGEHSIIISGYEHIPHKIPSEYVECNPLVGVIDSSYYNYRYLNPERGASIAEVRKAAKEKNRDIIIRLDLDNWQGTLQYLGLVNVSTDGSEYVQAMLFSTIKANKVSIDDSSETVTGTMQLEYWYTFLESTEGPPADAFVNFQFAEVNLTPGTSKAGYYMRVNKDGFWEATEGPTDEHINELIDSALTNMPSGLPEGAEANYQLVTDSTGASKWVPRLCYKEDTAMQFFVETISFDGNEAMAPANFVLVPGKQYRVSFDGTAYDCVAVDYKDAELVAIGNVALVDMDGGNGEPFAILDIHDTESEPPAIFVQNGNAEHSIWVAPLEDIYHQIEDGYIPSTIARKDDIPEVVSTALAEAKASGEFKGANGIGIKSITIKEVT